MNASGEEITSAENETTTTIVTAVSNGSNSITMSLSASASTEHADKGSTSMNLDTVISPEDKTGEVNESTTSSPLTKRQVCNLVSLVFAYACVISSTTMVVGTSAVIVLSVEGGTNQLSPFALAMFFVGSAFVSLLTSPMFGRYGRKVGFLVGCALGLIGALLGAVAIVISSPTLVIIASMPLGAANGIGFYLRFAAVEVVPEHLKSLAVTLVLSGGVIAAFLGPETAQATRDVFGDDLTYLGTYIMIALFNVVGACFTLAVKFPSLVHGGTEQTASTTTMKGASTSTMISLPEDDADAQHKEQQPPNGTTTTLKSLLLSSTFLIPCAMATASWCIMAMPMSIVRVVMTELGFTQRQSLTTIELHFVGMYGPGYVTGKIIDRFGAHVTSLLSIGCFVLAAILNLFASDDTSSNGALAMWILGLCIVGLGWNLGFSSSTVMLTRVYAASASSSPASPSSATEDASAFKARVQAANDFFMFLVSGGTTFSTGYIYSAGGGLLEGWRLVNYVVLGMIGVIAAIMVPAYVHERKKRLRLTKAASAAYFSASTPNDVLETSKQTSGTFPGALEIHERSCGFELAYDFRSVHSKV